MGRKKYVHDVGTVYVVEEREYRLQYTLRLVVRKISSGRLLDERYSTMTVRIMNNGKFAVSTRQCGRLSLNNFAKKSLTKKTYHKERLKFLMLTGSSIEGVIEGALARYRKFCRTRYSEKFDADQFNVSNVNIYEGVE